MPAGTDPDKVLSAVREVARSEIGHEWDYVLALHTDTPRPHVHVTVAARGDTGKRFNPRPQTLHHYRERFAEELRARGLLPRQRLAQRAVSAELVKAWP
ncbi:relaxase/mobilization nuclease domain-containing protein [Sphingobium scionense]